MLKPSQTEELHTVSWHGYELRETVVCVIAQGCCLPYSNSTVCITIYTTAVYLQYALLCLFEQSQLHKVILTCSTLSHPLHIPEVCKELMNSEHVLHISNSSNASEVAQNASFSRFVGLRTKLKRTPTNPTGV